MTKLYSVFGYHDNLHFKDKVVYVINTISVILALLFNMFYIFLIKFYPAVPSTTFYLLSCILVFFLLKNQQFTLAKLLMLIGFLLQESSVVFMWFPKATGFNFYYFIIVPITFFIFDFEVKIERLLIISFNVIATFMLFLSEALPDVQNAIEIPIKILWLFKGISVVTASGSIAVVFYIYSINLTNVHKELKFLANTDGLTRIFNRRALFEQGEKYFSASQKYNRDFSLALIDIDHFKKINDQHGHPVGDQILIQLTELVSKNIRQQDVFSRYGGEEFAVILKDTSLYDSYHIMDKLRKSIENHNFIVSAHETIQLTISAGVVQFHRDYKNFDMMVQHVDKALYQAKENGRNQVIQRKTIDSV